MSELFNKVMVRVFKSEGGYTDDPDDNGNWTGGKVGKGNLVGTNHGISSPILSKWLGRSANIQEMKSLSQARAKEIYWEYFWQKCHADKLPKGVQYMHYDASINHGVSGANKILQKTIGVVADGMVGKITLSKVHKANLSNYLVERACYYGVVITNKHSNAKYAKGWMARLKHVYEYTINELI